MTTFSKSVSIPGAIQDRSSVGILFKCIERDEAVLGIIDARPNFSILLIS